MNQPRRLRLVSEPGEPPTDGALLARVAQGEVSAIGRLYDSYAPILLNFARRMGASEEAEDVVQNVFVRAVQLAPRFESQVTSARPWLFAITVHIIQERRRAIRRLGNAMRALAAQKNAPLSINTPKRSDIERCLAKLTLAKRSVVLLADIEGFSCDEIAQMLDIPVGTVWTRMYHGRRELRDAWEGEP